MYFAIFMVKTFVTEQKVHFCVKKLMPLNKSGKGQKSSMLFQYCLDETAILCENF